MSVLRASEISPISEPDLTRSSPGNFKTISSCPVLYLSHVFIFYMIHSETELCVSFQVTMSHRGKLNRCGISWKIKWAILPLLSTAWHSLWRGLSCSGASQGKLASVICAINLLFPKDILWARQVLPTPLPRMFLADMFNMRVEVTATSTDSWEACFNFFFLLRAPAIFFHLIRPLGLLARSAVVTATGTSTAALWG